MRVFHWSLVACFATAWVTAGNNGRVHETAGYIALGLICFRIWWGFAGTRHALFADFVKSPRVIADYARQLLRGKSTRHVGHNPAGGAMILALLTLMALLCATGWMQLTRRFFGVEWVERVHDYTAHAILLLVPLHVAGAIVSSVLHKENLVKSMVTGWKPAGPHHEVTDAKGYLDRYLMDRLRTAEAFAVLGVIIGVVLYIGASTRRHDPTTPITEGPTAPAATEIAAELRRSLDEKDLQDYAAGGPDAPSRAWLISSGGRLYDNWFASLGKQPPATIHPSWPADDKPAAVADTWRCKSCHGWDYMGRDGQLGTNGAGPGIKGVWQARGREVDEIVAILAQPKHGFTDELLPHHAKYRLAQFITRGLHSTARVISNRNGSIQGDALAGKAVFQNMCAACHGFDGRARKLGVSAKPGYTGPLLFVGTKARANPQEVLHKIRNGHPGAIMVSLRPFAFENSVNALAYLQQLPSQ